jgi:hypothetical protein
VIDPTRVRKALRMLDAASNLLQDVSVQMAPMSLELRQAVRELTDAKALLWDEVFRAER